MADAALHIKDSYYFEVPKALWRYDFEDELEIPASAEFLRHAHPELSLDEFGRELSGKILIPQPFARLKNLHEVESGFGISKFMLLELLVAIVLTLLFVWLAQRLRSGSIPRGKLPNLLEAFLVFLRDEVARPAIGHHDADRFLPLLWTMFFFILTCNLLGMIPWLGAPTGAFGATFGMACVTFGTTLIAGSIKFGPAGFWFNQVPHMDLPWYMKPLKLFIFAIEVFGLVIKHCILSVRLLANMVAGHLVLLGILGLIAGSATAGLATWGAVAAISIIGSTLFSLLELFVAFLQAYIFTFLSALFIGAAVHKH